MDITEKHLHQVWQVEQEILDVIHSICKRNNLRYTLIFGTLLGAVRHGGFIPWDDDIDILMPREDYEKLLVIWKDEAPKGYIMQNKRIVFDFTQNFTKVVKDNTTFLQDDDARKRSFHKGIFVDIFPADRVAPNAVSRKMQYFANALNLLSARGYTSGKKGVFRVVEKAILSLPQKTQLVIFKKTEKYIAKWDNNSNCHWYSPNTMDVCKRYFDADIFDNMTTIDFNGKSYYCVREYDKLLTSIYRNYMQWPPEKDRVWKHHPILIDLEHNYSEVVQSEEDI